MSERPTVADHIVRRLTREGITDCFGVAGDFAFKLCDAVVRGKAICWIGCSNELDAAYAVDGYARVRGCSMLLTTYWKGSPTRRWPGPSAAASERGRAGRGLPEDAAGAAVAARRRCLRGIRLTQGWVSLGS